MLRNAFVRDGFVDRGGGQDKGHASPPKLAGIAYHNRAPRGFRHGSIHDLDEGSVGGRHWNASHGPGGDRHTERKLEPYLPTPSNSTSKISVALGGIKAPAPRAP